MSDHHNTPHIAYRTINGKSHRCIDILAMLEALNVLALEADAGFSDSNALLLGTAVIDTDSDPGLKSDRDHFAKAIDAAIDHAVSLIETAITNRVLALAYSETYKLIFKDRGAA